MRAPGLVGPLASTISFLAALALPLPARAQPAEDAPPTPEEPAHTADASARERAERLESDVRKLREDLEELKKKEEAHAQQVRELAPLKNRFTGYVDLGAFYVQGNGSGIRPDLGYGHYPEYSGVVPDTWVFMGDPLATAINSRGEPPDLGGSRAIAFDPIHNGGKSSFLVNAVNFALFHGVGDHLTINAMIDFVPRGRDVSKPEGQGLGDYLDVKLAYGEYIVPIEAFDLSLYAGKLDSVLGIEYRTQESPDRIGVTPSLICRYTCGRPIGLKARARFFDERLVANLAVTNGSNIVELFPFYNEIDFNQGKTVSSRVSYRFPIGGRGLELGVSGAFGAQDLQSDDATSQWHAGADARLEVGDLDVRLELVKGRAAGKSSGQKAPCDEAPCLDYKGGYLQTSYRVTNWLVPYVRGDFRDALHRSGASFVYVSQVARGTGGLRFELGTNVVLKAEYTHVQELGRASQFPDDVVTSSAVLKF